MIRYRCAEVNVNVPVTAPAAERIRSSDERSEAVVARWVYPVPAVIVVDPVSSITATKTRSPAAVVVRLGLAMLLAAVEPFAIRPAVISSGFVFAVTSLLPDALCTKPTGNTALETVTLTPALVVAFPVGSFATAVSVWTPLADKVVFQLKVYGLPVRSPLRAVVPAVAASHSS
jgi:hypothetical protein